MQSATDSENRKRFEMVYVWAYSLRLSAYWTCDVMKMIQEFNLISHCLLVLKDYFTIERLIFNFVQFCLLLFAISLSVLFIMSACYTSFVNFSYSSYK